MYIKRAAGFISFQYTFLIPIYHQPSTHLAKYINGETHHLYPNRVCVCVCTTWKCVHTSLAHQFIYLSFSVTHTLRKIIFNAIYMKYIFSWLLCQYKCSVIVLQIRQHKKKDQHCVSTFLSFAPIWVLLLLNFPNNQKTTNIFTWNKTNENQKKNQFSELAARRFLPPSLPFLLSYPPT